MISLPEREVLCNRSMRRLQIILPDQWAVASPRPGVAGEKQQGRVRHMETVYDWVTVAIFAGLIVLFLQR